MAGERSRVRSHVRRATSTDFVSILRLLTVYYDAFAIQQRDSEAQTLVQINDPKLGYLCSAVDSEVVGCVLVKALPGLRAAAECKRLFVLPAARGLRLGERLMDAAESLAAEAHYEWMYLDSNPMFARAIALYQQRGYKACERYNDNPQATLFLRKRLT